MKDDVPSLGMCRKWALVMTPSTATILVRRREDRLYLRIGFTGVLGEDGDAADEGGNTKLILDAIVVPRGPRLGPRFQHKIRDG